MAVIHKHRFDSFHETVDLPKDAEFRHLGLQGNDVVMWYQTSAPTDCCKQEFALIATGMPFDPETHVYIGTVIFASTVWHLHRIH